MPLQCLLFAQPAECPNGDEAAAWLGFNESAGCILEQEPDERRFANRDFCIR